MDGCWRRWWIGIGVGIGIGGVGDVCTLYSTESSLNYHPLVAVCWLLIDNSIVTWVIADRCTASDVPYLYIGCTDDLQSLHDADWLGIDYLWYL